MDKQCWAIVIMTYFLRTAALLAYIFLGSETTLAQTPIISSKALGAEELSDSDIRVELKQEIFKLTYERDGRRVVRLIGAQDEVRGVLHRGLSSDTASAGISDASKSNPSAAKYAITCNPLGLPTLIDGTDQAETKRQSEINQKTEQGVLFKSYDKVDREFLKKIDRIAELSCVEPEIK